MLRKWSHLAQHRVLVGNRCRLGDEPGGDSERAAGRLPRLRIGLVADARECHQIDVILELELPQDVEGSVGHPAVGWVREALGEKEETRSRSHVSFLLSTP